MLTSLQIYDRIRRTIQNRQDKQPLAKFPLHPDDKFDLMKIKIRDLTARGVDEGQAQVIVAALMQLDFGPFGRHLGVELVISDDARSLFGNG